jgi:hypothetical protein
MLDKRIENIDESKGIIKERNTKTQLDLFEMCFEPMNNLLFSKLEKFNKYFKSVNIIVGNQHKELKPKNLLELNNNVKHLLNYTNYPDIKIGYTFSTLTKLGLVNYNLHILIIIKFEEFLYKIGFGYVENNEVKILNKFEKLYHQIIYSDEIQSVNKQIAEYLINKIESEIGNIENGK